MYNQAITRTHTTTHTCTHAQTHLCLSLLQYVMFEVDQMKDVSGTAAKQLPDGVAELFKIATQNGIRVSDVMQPFTHPSPRKSIPA